MARKIISIALTVLACLSLLCAITVTGSGFLDLSNIARIVFLSITFLCLIAAFLTWPKQK